MVFIDFWSSLTSYLLTSGLLGPMVFVDLWSSLIHDLCWPLVFSDLWSSLTYSFLRPLVFSYQWLWVSHIFTSAFNFSGVLCRHLLWLWNDRLPLVPNWLSRFLISATDMCVYNTGLCFNFYVCISCSSEATVPVSMTFGVLTQQLQRIIIID